MSNNNSTNDERKLSVGVLNKSSSDVKEVSLSSHKHLWFMWGLVIGIILGVML